jgi:predicted membrane channel-forming protein YqfA (hemolysin III family)
MIHNELINIWTHFLGAIFMIILTLYLFTSYNNVDIHNWKERLT